MSSASSSYCSPFKSILSFFLSFSAIAGGAKHCQTVSLFCILQGQAAAAATALFASPLFNVLLSAGRRFSATRGVMNLVIIPFKATFQGMTIPKCKLHFLGTPLKCKIDC